MLTFNYRQLHVLDYPIFKLTFILYDKKRACHGNMVVGGVIFLIITVVQFMVITKGAERIAEVAARFALDAMPGKQMTIDADFNAGLL